MSLKRQFAFWVAAFCGFAFFLYLFSGILLPFIAGMFLAYLLDPVADRLERLGFSRLWATFTILFVFVILFAVTMIIILPVIGHQLAGFIGRLPDYVSQIQDFFARRARGGRIAAAAGMSQDDLKSSVTSLMTEAASWLGRLAQGIWSGGQALMSVMSLLFVTPVVAFYLLLDWDRMVAKVDSWLPREHAETVRALAREMNDGIAGFIRGQVLVCLLLGSYFALALSLIGLNFGLLIGMMIGLISFIPYVGSATGFVVSVGVAIAQFAPDDWFSVVMVVAIFGLGQFIEGNILQPKLVGGHVGLHPVWLMFALFAFGSLFGFVGMLVAVPAAAAVGVLCRFALRAYLKSPYYKGADPVEDDLA